MNRALLKYSIFRGCQANRVTASGSGTPSVVATSLESAHVGMCSRARRSMADSSPAVPGMLSVSTRRSEYSHQRRTRNTTTQTSSLLQWPVLSCRADAKHNRNHNHNHHGNAAARSPVFQALRYFDSRKKQPTKRPRNPFKVLSVKKGVTPYKDAKKRFLQIAMKHHPDTVSSDSDPEKMKEIFIAARIAFESLAEDENGAVMLRSIKEKEEKEENDMNAWFRDETGHNMPFMDMDPETMREVASMTDNMSVGLDRDGGMWTLAKMVTSAVKSGEDATAMLRIDGGDVKEKTGGGTTSVRRRRRRF